VFYLDVSCEKKKWVECDLVIIQDDVLLVIEAKAGAMPMHSPETNFERFQQRIEELVLKAYAQCKRFLDYLASAPEVNLFHFIDGKYVSIARLRLRDFRVILPIGLTAEAFTPFSSMVKANPDVKPLLGKHSFVSMSVDDLFVLNRFLPNTGDLLHYLGVRQRAAEIPAVMIFDEMDHLGAYVSHNRFDMDLKRQLTKVDTILMDSFCDVIDQHFESRDWETSPVPHQEFPEQLSSVLAALDKYRPRGWLSIDAWIRDQSGEMRSYIADTIGKLWPTLQEFPTRRFLLGAELPVEIWMCRSGREPMEMELQRSGQISCVVTSAPRLAVLILSFSQTRAITNVAYRSVSAPTLLQIDYLDVVAEAKRRQKLVKAIPKTALQPGRRGPSKRSKRVLGKRRKGQQV
jgi:hypothetical protein